MEITWHGDTALIIKGKVTTISVNTDKAEDKSDIILSTLEEGKFKNTESTRVFDWAGEYETKGVPITAIRAETKESETLIFHFIIDGIKCCYAGLLDKELEKEKLKNIGDVDILMIDLNGDDEEISKIATEIIEGIEPKIIIPVGEVNSSAHLKELGIEGSEKIDKFEINSISDSGESQMKYVFLNEVK